jgi:hypothetical protein
VEHTSIPMWSPSASIVLKSPQTKCSGSEVLINVNTYKEDKIEVRLTRGSSRTLRWQDRSIQDRSVRCYRDCLLARVDRVMVVEAPNHYTYDIRLVLHGMMGHYVNLLRVITSQIYYLSLTRACRLHSVHVFLHFGHLFLPIRSLWAARLTRISLTSASSSW